MGVLDEVLLGGGRRTQKLTLPYIADEFLPRAAAETQRLGATAEARSKELLRLITDAQNQTLQDDGNLRHLYEVVNKLRGGAVDAQNYVDRAFGLSQYIVPHLEGAYPCASDSAHSALQRAHKLHLTIGRAKEAIGNPPGGLGHEKEDGGGFSFGEGAADILSEMERRLGTLVHKSAEDSAVVSESTGPHPLVVAAASVRPPALQADTSLSCSSSLRCSRLASRRRTSPLMSGREAVTLAEFL